MTFLPRTGRREEGANPDFSYDELRNRYRPPHVEVLLIGESPPAPRGETVPFFYADHLGADNLFRGVAEAVLGLDSQALRRESKSRVLSELQERGLWLIDAVDHPVNQLPMPERRREVREAVEGLVARALEANPHKGIVICHGLVYRYAVAPLKDVGLIVLHDEPLPFPSMGHRQRFIAGLRYALGLPGEQV